MGNEEDGHLVSDLEETPIHDVCQEEHSTRFYCPGPISKQRPYWDEFVQYKTSEEGVSRVIKNQRNAQQKTYHHNLRSGGYPTAIKKWNKMEADLLAKGITPESLEWGEHAKNWFFRSWGNTGPGDREVRLWRKTARSSRKIVLCSERYC